MTNSQIENFELTNTLPLCPVMLVLDTSHSMWGKGMFDLKDALQTFFQTVEATDIPESMIHIASVSMGDHLSVLEGFTSLPQSSLRNLNIRPKGDTPIGAALDLALNEIHEFGASCKRMPVKGCLPPHLIILSDGISTDDFSRQASLIRKMKQCNGLYCTAVAIGENPNMNALRAITNDVLIAGEDNLRVAFAMVGREVSQCCEDAIKDRSDVITVEAVAEEIPVNIPVPVRDENGTLYLLDGSNIIHWDHSSNEVSLEPLLAITADFEQHGERYMVFFDASAKYLFQNNPSELTKFQDLLNDAEHFQQVPAGSRADDFLLVIADNDPKAVILTQDLFWDYESRYPHIVKSDRVVTGMMLRNMIFFPKINRQILFS